MSSTSAPSSGVEEHLNPATGEIEQVTVTTTTVVTADEPVNSLANEVAAAAAEAVTAKSPVPTDTAVTNTTTTVVREITEEEADGVRPPVTTATSTATSTTTSTTEATEAPIAATSVATLAEEISEEQADKGPREAGAGSSVTPEQAVAESVEMAREETPASSSVNPMQEQIDNLKAVIEERRALLQEKERLIAENEWTVELFKETQNKHSAVSKELSELEKKKAMTMPEYENLKRNTHLIEEAAKIKAEIEELPKRIASINAESARYEAELSEASKQYKDATTKSMTFLKHVQDSIEDLRKAISKKIEVAIGDSGTIDASDALELLADTVRTRERQLSSLEKETVEHRHVCTIREGEIKELERSTTENIKQLRQQKDETIREAVYNFQSERAKLHQDIDSMKKINKDQSTQLRGGLKRLPAEKGGFGMKSTLNPQPVEEQMELEEKTQDILQGKELLKDEILTIHDEIKNASLMRAEALRENKQLVIKLKHEAEAMKMKLGKLDKDIRATKLASLRIIKENQKLAGFVSQLTSQTKLLKGASEVAATSSTHVLPLE